MSIDIACTMYIQMHKDYAKIDLLAEFGFRINNDSRVKLVPEVYTDRMRFVYKGYSFVSLSVHNSSCAYIVQFRGE